MSNEKPVITSRDNIIQVTVSNSRLILQDMDEYVSNEKPVSTSGVDIIQVTVSNS